VDLSKYPHNLPCDFGPYRLESRLGEGGMGAVFLGIELESASFGVRAESAIKIPDAKLLRNDPTMAAQFVREAQAASQVRHPAVVKLEKVGVVGDIPYIAMDRLHGEGLEKTLERGPMPPADVLAAGIAICGGLDAVHKAGLIHRDLKPSNIFRTTHGEFKLLDLGIAKAMDAATRMTGTGMSKGTPGYMAPEQLEDGKSLDQRTDLFALGAVLAELALGEPIFVGETLMSLLLLMSKAEAHVADSSIGPRVNSVCPGLGDVVVACMRQKPSTRPASAAEVRSTLAALSTAPVSVAPVSQPPVVPEPREPSPAPPPKREPAATRATPTPKKAPPATTPVSLADKETPRRTRAVQRPAESPTPPQASSVDTDEVEIGSRRSAGKALAFAGSSGGLVALVLGVPGAMLAFGSLAFVYSMGLVSCHPNELVISIDPLAETVLVDGVEVGSGAEVVIDNPGRPVVIEARHPRFKNGKHDLSVDDWREGRVDLVLDLAEPLDFEPDDSMRRASISADKAQQVMMERAAGFDRCIAQTASEGEVLTGTVRVFLGSDGRAVGMNAEGKNTERTELLDCFARQAVVVDVGRVDGDYATIRYQYSVVADSGATATSPAPGPIANSVPAPPQVVKEMDAEQLRRFNAGISSHMNAIKYLKTLKEEHLSVDVNDEKKATEILFWAYRAATTADSDVAAELLDYVEFPPDGQAWRVQATRALISVADGNPDSGMRILDALADAGAPAEELASARTAACALVTDKAKAREFACPMVFHHSELEVKKRVAAIYPTHAETHLGDQRCLAVVQIEETGVPTSVDVLDCPEVFHASTIASVMKWRWYPPKDGGQKVKAQTTVTVKYTKR